MERQALFADVIDPINGSAALERARPFGLSKEDIIEGMRTDQFEFHRGLLYNNDPGHDRSFIRISKSSFDKWLAAYQFKKQIEQLEDFNRKFAQIMVGIGHVKREIHDIKANLKLELRKDTAGVQKIFT